MVNTSEPPQWSTNPTNMSSIQTEPPTRIPLDKSEAYRQDSDGNTANKDKQEFSKPDSSHWYSRRARSSSEGDSKANTQTVNLYTHCGRHSNQFLFGPISESIKGLLRKGN
ncbi:hypothetical protein GGR58DRAFT_47677 [Xylaria digitata]|nr:hypothetical protein GGR58DRAFT_47677 [Xylaria digitata]